MGLVPVETSLVEEMLTTLGSACATTLATLSLRSRTSPHAAEADAAKTHEMASIKTRAGWFFFVAAMFLMFLRLLRVEGYSVGGSFALSMLSLLGGLSPWGDDCC